MQSQSALDRWYSDFDMCTRVLRSGALSVELVGLLIPPCTAEDDEAHRIRSLRLVKACRYVLANAGAFETIGELGRRDDGSIEASPALVYALYLFFTSELYGEEPDLELVIDAVLRVADGTGGPESRRGL